MTHNVFLPTVQISQMLMLYYKMLDDKNDFQYENSINNKRKVIAFIKEWCEVAKDAFYEDQVIKNFFQVIFFSMLNEISLKTQKCKIIKCFNF
jgi:hypothetical protein